jgi:hypothetical protein
MSARVSSTAQPPSLVVEQQPGASGDDDNGRCLTGGDQMCGIANRRYPEARHRSGDGAEAEIVCQFGGALTDESIDCVDADAGIGAHPEHGVDQQRMHRLARQSSSLMRVVRADDRDIMVRMSGHRSVLRVRLVEQGWIGA